MDEDITIIDAKTRNEKIKNFFTENKKIFLSALILLILIVLSIYTFQIYKDNKREALSDQYNSSIIEYENGNNTKSIFLLKQVVEKKDTTYSPLALYFLIDNNLIKNIDEVNDLFDILIKKTSLDKEIKNLIIYKKALYNADTINENDLLNILKPLTNSKSVWKSHALYLIAEYFYSKNEKEKSKEFFNQILNVENANQEIIKEAQKRINRDLGE